MDCLTKSSPFSDEVAATVAHVALPDGRCSLGFESCTEYRVRYYQYLENFIIWTKGSVEDKAMCDLDAAELALVRLVLLRANNNVDNIISTVLTCQYWYLELNRIIMNLENDTGKLVLIFECSRCMTSSRFQF
jgi:hypothetical protein